MSRHTHHQDNSPLTSRPFAGLRAPTAPQPTEGSAAIDLADIEAVEEPVTEEEDGEVSGDEPTDPGTALAVITPAQAAVHNMTNAVHRMARYFGIDLPTNPAEWRTAIVRFAETDGGNRSDEQIRGYGCVDASDELDGWRGDIMPMSMVIAPPDLGIQHLCVLDIVEVPEKDGKKGYQLIWAMPFGVVDLETISAWNEKVVGNAEYFGYYPIAPISALMLRDTNVPREFRFTPDEVMERSRRVRRGRKWETVVDRKIGSYRGKTVVLINKSRVPPADVEAVFRLVKETKSKIIVFYVGSSDEIEIDQQSVPTLQQITLPAANPFAAFDTSPEHADKAFLDRQFEVLINLKPDEDHPTLKACAASGYPIPEGFGARRALIRETLKGADGRSGAYKTCLEELERIRINALQSVEASMVDHDLVELLGAPEGHDPEAWGAAIKFSRKGEDAFAKAFDGVIEGGFNPTNPTHRAIRSALVDKALQRLRALEADSALPRVLPAIMHQTKVQGVSLTLDVGETLGVTNMTLEELEEKARALLEVEDGYVEVMERLNKLLPDDKPLSVKNKVQILNRIREMLDIARKSLEVPPDAG